MRSSFKTNKHFHGMTLKLNLTDSYHFCLFPIVQRKRYLSSLILVLFSLFAEKMKWCDSTIF